LLIIHNKNTLPLILSHYIQQNVGHMLRNAVHILLIIFINILEIENAALIKYGISGIFKGCLLKF